MKYTKKFEKYDHYLAYANKLDHTNTPNISLCDNTGSIYFTPYIPFVQEFEYVDLGLPSGNKWAKCNLGASSETDIGNYYYYGDIVAKDDPNAKQYWGNMTDYGVPQSYSKYNDEDNLLVLELIDDAMNVNIGEHWFTPSIADWTELFNSEYTTCTWYTDYLGQGIYGLLVESKINSNYIFIPTENTGEYSSCRYLTSQLSTPNSLYEAMAGSWGTEPGDDYEGNRWDSKLLRGYYNENK